MDRFLEFTGNHPLLVSLLVGSFLAALFTELRQKANRVFNLDVADAVKLINDDAVVIDLRSAESFGRGHIPNARNIPSADLDARLGQLEPYKAKQIVAVCDTGVSSNRAVMTLRKNGFDSVFGLRGGMTGWGQAGYPVVSGKKTQSKSEKSKKGKKA